MNNQNTMAAGINQFYAKGLCFSRWRACIECHRVLFDTSSFPLPNRFIHQQLPVGFMGLWIVELILVMVLGVKAQKNPSLAIGGFVAYSLLNGLTLAVTLSYYDIGSITKAFITAQVCFRDVSCRDGHEERPKRRWSCGNGCIDRRDHRNGIEHLHFAKQCS